MRKTGREKVVVATHFVSLLELSPAMAAWSFVRWLHGTSGEHTISVGLQSVTLREGEARKASRHGSLREPFAPRENSGSAGWLSSADDVGRLTSGTGMATR